MNDSIKFVVHVTRFKRDDGVIVIPSDFPHFGTDGSVDRDPPPGWEQAERRIDLASFEFVMKRPELKSDLRREIRWHNVCAGDVASSDWDEPYKLMGSHLVRAAEGRAQIAVTDRGDGRIGQVMNNAIETVNRISTKMDMAERQEKRRQKNDLSKEKELVRKAWIKAKKTGMTKKRFSEIHVYTLKSGNSPLITRELVSFDTIYKKWLKGI